MCEIRTNAHSDWRRYPCGREGKHAVEVVTNMRDKENTKRLTIQVCGQHKRMLEKGQNLVIRVGQNEVWVEGTVSERGEAELLVEAAKEHVLYKASDVQRAKQHIGALAVTHLENLLILTSGLHEFATIHNALLDLQNKQDQLREAWDERARAEERLERIKEGQ